LPQWALRARWTAYYDKAIIHRLSHQVLHAHFWIIEDFEQSMPHSWDLVRSKGVPRLIERFCRSSDDNVHLSYIKYHERNTK